MCVTHKWAKNIIQRAQHFETDITSKTEFDFGICKKPCLLTLFVLFKMFLCHLCALLPRSFYCDLCDKQLLEVLLRVVFFFFFNWNSRFPGRGRRKDGICNPFWVDFIELESACSDGSSLSSVTSQRYT